MRGSYPPFHTGFELRLMPAKQVAIKGASLEAFTRPSRARTENLMFGKPIQETLNPKP